MGKVPTIWASVKTYLYIGSDPAWAHGLLAIALGTEVEVVEDFANAMFHGPDCYELVFLDLTGATRDNRWEQTISRLWHQDLRVVVISPIPNWGEARGAMRSGAVGYHPKEGSLAQLGMEIDRSKNTPAHHPR